MINRINTCAFVFLEMARALCPTTKHSAIIWTVLQIMSGYVPKMCELVSIMFLQNAAQTFSDNKITDNGQRRTNHRRHIYIYIYIFI